MGQRHRTRTRRSHALARGIVPATLLLLCAAVTVIGAPSSGAVTMLDASPTTNLVDGSLVHVSLTGFTSGASVVVDECGAPTTCRPLFVGRVDASGALAVTVRVFAVVTADGTTIDCRTVTTCGLTATEVTQSISAAGPTPLAFVPGSPLTPPTFVAAPSTGLNPGDPVTFSGTGLNADVDIPIIRCSQGLLGAPGVSCPSGATPQVIIHTDAAGSFSTTAPLEVPAETDAFFGGVPVPDPGCPPTGGCIVYALLTAVPETALSVAVAYTPTPTTTTTSTPLAPPAPVVAPAVPVRGTPAFTG